MWLWVAGFSWAAFSVGFVAGCAWSGNRRDAAHDDRAAAEHAYRNN